MNDHDCADVDRYGAPFCNGDCDDNERDVSRDTFDYMPDDDGYYADMMAERDYSDGYGNVY